MKKKIRLIRGGGLVLLIVAIIYLGIQTCGSVTAATMSGPFFQAARPGVRAEGWNRTTRHNDLSNQVRIFQDARVRQLTARAAELKSELAAAYINRDTAAAALAYPANGGLRRV